MFILQRNALSPLLKALQREKNKLDVGKPACQALAASLPDWPTWTKEGGDFNEFVLSLKDLAEDWDEQSDWRVVLVINGCSMSFVENNQGERFFPTFEVPVALWAEDPKLKELWSRFNPFSDESEWPIVTDEDRAEVQALHHALSMLGDV